MNTNNDIDFLSSNIAWSNNLTSNIGLTCNFKPTNILLVYNTEQKEIIKIAADGRIFWEGREVTTDDDYREAMVVLVKRWLTPC